MALSYTSIPRFPLHRLQTTTGFLHGSTTNPVRLSELTRGPRRKSQQTSTSAHCLLGVVTASDLQTTLLNDLVSSDFASRSTQTITDFISENSLHAPSYTHTILLADLDPATAKLVIGVMGPFLSAFGFLFIVRIVMSWYPKLPVGKFPYVIAYAPTEPILGLTRKLIPPVGGVDVTPVVWFGLISFLNEILVGPQGLLVLLSQQV